MRYAYFSFNLFGWGVDLFIILLDSLFSSLVVCVFMDALLLFIIKIFMLS